MSKVVIAFILGLVAVLAILYLIVLYPVQSSFSDAAANVTMPADFTAGEVANYQHTMSAWPFIALIIPIIIIVVMIIRKVRQ